MDGTQVRCSCGAEIGVEVVVVAGIERLQVGHLIVQSVHGVCAVCGQEFHWSLSERKLQELVQYVIRQRGDVR